VVTCLNCKVKIRTVINWTVISNPKPNRNRSPNPVLTARISTIQISPGNFTVQNLIVQISYGSKMVRIPLHVRKCLHIGNRTYNSSHCMSGTRRAVSNAKRREVSFFSAHKRPSPLFLYIPHKNPLLNRSMINLLSLAYAEYS